MDKIIWGQVVWKLLRRNRVYEDESIKNGKKYSCYTILEYSSVSIFKSKNGLHILYYHIV